MAGLWFWQYERGESDVCVYKLKLRNLQWQHCKKKFLACFGFWLYPCAWGCTSCIFCFPLTSHFFFSCTCIACDSLFITSLPTTTKTCFEVSNSVYITSQCIHLNPPFLPTLWKCKGNQLPSFSPFSLHSRVSYTMVSLSPSLWHKHTQLLGILSKSNVTNIIIFTTIELASFY